MTKTFTVRQLITQLLFYPLDAKACIQCSEVDDVLEIARVEFYADDHDDVEGSGSFIVLADANQD